MNKKNKHKRFFFAKNKNKRKYELAFFSNKEFALNTMTNRSKNSLTPANKQGNLAKGKTKYLKNTLLESPRSNTVLHLGLR